LIARIVAVSFVIWRRIASPDLRVTTIFGLVVGETFAAIPASRFMA
jgi:hypothetical protein